MGTTTGQRRGTLVAVSLGALLLWVGLGVVGWGSASGFFAHPARILMVVLAIAMTLVGLASPVNFSSGVEEDAASRVLFVPAAAGMLLLFWLLPYLDRRDRWTLDGDAVRYLGVVLLLVGGVLRIWPMFVLRERFSGLVAIQPGHELATGGPYRYVRHPSYLGMMLGLAGFALIFRSSIGLAATALGLVVLVRRIDAEEALLASHFGAAYERYRQRTWRLVPGLY